MLTALGAEDRRQKKKWENILSLVIASQRRSNLKYEIATLTAFARNDTSELAEDRINRKQMTEGRKQTTDNVFSALLFLLSFCHSCENRNPMMFYYPPLLSGEKL
ncbi:hypothetical protein KAS42_01915 [bacterium]|nr:hypothetical protein [bacterium]